MVILCICPFGLPQACHLGPYVYVRHQCYSAIITNPKLSGFPVGPEVLRNRSINAYSSVTVNL